MGDYVLKDCKFYLGKYNFSGDANQGRLMYGVEEKDKTTFGSGGSKEFRAGVRSSSVELQVLYDTADGADDVDAVQFTRVGATQQPCSICPTDGADGEIAYMLESLFARYAPGASHGEILIANITGQSHDVLVRGTVMATGSKTTTANGTARQLGAVTATQKLYATLHVFSASGTNPTLDVIVESDDAEGFLSGDTKITFAQATAATVERATPVSGAITDDWWRVGWTIGGTDTPTFSIAVIVAIQ